MYEGLLQSRTILISGTHLWNPGDDFVRNGVIRVLREALPEYSLNFLFYDFNPEEVRPVHAPRSDNRIAPCDLPGLAGAIDAVVIAGLSAGSEIEPLMQGILAAGLEDRVFMIGAGYENDYAAAWMEREPAATLFRKARVITGRTAKHPAWMDRQGIRYQHLNCPAILSVPAVRSVAPFQKIERVLFSIQLPQDLGVPNQATGRPMFELACGALLALRERYDVAVLAHHKSEYAAFATGMAPEGVPVLFSSFEEHLEALYPSFDLVVTTRLHAALYANGHGIPGLILNDTDRHTHCLHGFTHTWWARDAVSFAERLQALAAMDLAEVALELQAFKAQLLAAYVQTLREPLLEVMDRAKPARIDRVDDFSFDSELKEQQLVRRLVKPGMKVLDVGAHHGKYTRLLAHLVGPTGRVVAFEPTPASAEVLESRIRLAGFTQVELRREAVFSEPGFVELHEFPQTYSSWNSLGVPAMPDPQDSRRIVPVVATRQVRANSLDAYCRGAGLEQVDYLKLDVEGAELDALRGAQHLLRTGGIRYLQFEISQKPLEGMGRKAKDVFDYLATFGYEVHAITPEGEVGPRLGDSDAFYDNYIAFRTPRTPAVLPVHFFTIVLNGMPFLRHHIEMLKQLPFEWHWHVVEGVAALKHDTAWSLSRGGFVSDETHLMGLSLDGTSEYLDALVWEFPDQVTVYRKPRGRFWDGKLEMVNAPIPNIPDGALLWQVDADELWTPEQAIRLRELFLGEPDRTAAYFWCHFFVAPELVIGSRHTYGNQGDIEWLRVFRFPQGARWSAHEPPVLKDARGQELATIHPFRHEETEAHGLVFQHFAYADPSQLAFKETYYGYAGAREAWARLKACTAFPARLKDYFPWVEDEATVVTVASQGITPLAHQNAAGEWTFGEVGTDPEPAIEPFAERPVDDPQHILWIRPDAIGDNLLAMSMLGPIREKYPEAKISVVCQPQVSELYEACPLVDDVLTVDKGRALRDSDYLKEVMADLGGRGFDLCLHSVYSREPIGDGLASASGAPRRIAHYGDDHNRRPEDRPLLDRVYTELVDPGEGWDLELCRHEAFLAHLGITASGLQPVVWTTAKDAERVDELLDDAGIAGCTLIGLFPGAQHGTRVYGHYAEALAPLLREHPDWVVVGLGSAEEEGLVAGTLEALEGRTVNFCGRLKLRQSAELLRRCKAAVGAETGLAHMACAVGTPHAVVLGGGHFGRFMPYSPFTTCAVLPVDCLCCDWKCKHARPHCVKDLAPEVLTEALQRALEPLGDRPRVVAQGGWNLPPGGPACLDLAAHLEPSRVDLQTLPWTPVASCVPGPRAAQVAVVTFPHRPLPGNTGAKTRFLSQLSMLRDLGYRTHLLASSFFSDQPWDSDAIRQLYEGYGALTHLHVGSQADWVWNNVQGARGLPMDLEKQLVPGYVAAFRRLLEQHPPDLLLVNYVEWSGLLDAPEFGPDVLRVQENHDLNTLNTPLQKQLFEALGGAPHALLTARREALELGFPPRPDPATLPGFREEMAALDRFDVVLAISPVEADLMRQFTSHPEVLALSMSFEAKGAEGNTHQGQPVFLASPNFFNVQAYLHTAAKLAPHFPAGMELQVIGGLGKYVQAYPGLQLRGYVDVLEGAYRQAPFAVCPLLTGTGQQVKILEAMAYGVPVVAYQGIARSSPIVDGENGLLADSPEAFLRHVHTLWRDRALCRRLGRAAAETVRTVCSYDRGLEVLDATFTRATRSVNV